MKLASFIQAEVKKGNDFHRRMAEYEKERQIGLDKARKSMFPSLRKASREDYIKWLEGFVDADNVPTHYYDYPFDRCKDSFYVAVTSSHD